MSSSKRARRRLGWRWFYGAENQPIAIAEEQPGGTWKVSVRGRPVGVFGSERAAAEFVSTVMAAPREETG